MLKEVLENNLTYDADLFEIVPVEIANQQEMNRMLATLKRNKKLLCIVSHFSFKEQIPQFSVDDVLSLRAVTAIQHLIDTEGTYRKMAETLKHHLRSIDPQQVVPDIRTCLDKLQARLNLSIPTNDLVGIVLHGCCMVDRIVSGEQPVVFSQREQYIAAHRELYDTTKEILTRLEQVYQMRLGDDEICFMMRFFDPEVLGS